MTSLAVDVNNIRGDQFPARSRQSSGVVNGVPTDVTLVDFADKVMITICQDGRLSQWVFLTSTGLTNKADMKKIQVPLTGSSAGVVEMTLPTASHGLLPSTHLTPKTLLGGGGDDRETLGQLYAAQIASQISLRSPDDRRILVLGLGLATFSTGREAFFDLLELAQRVL